MTEESQRKTVLDLVRRGWIADVSDSRFGTSVEKAELRIRRTEDAIATLERGIADGEITKARIDDARRDISSSFETAYRHLVRPITRVSAGGVGSVRPRLSPVVHGVVQMHPQFYELPNAVRRIEAAADLEPSLVPAIAIVRAFLPLHDLLVRARRAIVPARKGSAQVRETIAEGPASKALRIVLDEFTRASADALRETARDRIVSSVERYLRRQEEAVAAGETVDHEFLTDALSFDGGRHGRIVFHDSIANVRALCADGVDDVPGGRHAFVRRPDADEIATRMAIVQAKRAQEAFVAKNLAKIAPICEAKGMVPTASSGETSIAVGRMTGEIVIAFEDGCRFVARNGIVENVSSRGIRYVQYPLRFADVVVPGQDLRRAAPEAWMRETFPGLAPSTRS